MKIARIDNFLYIEGRKIRVPFSFEVANVLNSTSKTAMITINPLFLAEKKINIEIGTMIRLGMIVNGDKEFVLFSGTVAKSIRFGDVIKIEARFEAVKQGIVNETLVGMSYKEAFSKLVENLDFRVDDVIPQQIILKGLAKNSFHQLIASLSSAIKKPLYYYLLGDSTLVITSKLEQEKRFRIGDYALSLTTDMIETFPIPEMEIGNMVFWLLGSRTVKSIIWKTAPRISMFLGVGGIY